MVSCDGLSCCTHPAESEAVLKRDGVLHLVCTECHSELGPAPEITVAAIGDIESCQLTQNASAPCGDEIAHRWGWL